MRQVRGNRISIIFQDPMTRLNPRFHYRNQDEEAILLHTQRNKNEARERAIEMLRLVGINEPEKRIQPIRVRAFRRHAPARDDRHGAGLRAGYPHADEPTTALDVHHPGAESSS
jgi:oligopeptide transport system ATP-binding protein